MRGSEESFNVILAELAKLTKNYETHQIKHYQWADGTERVFQNYGWSKPEFYKELRRKLGANTNESREEDKKNKKVAPKTRKT